MTSTSMLFHLTFSAKTTGFRFCLVAFPSNKIAYYYVYRYVGICHLLNILSMVCTYCNPCCAHVLLTDRAMRGKSSYATREADFKYL